MKKCSIAFVLCLLCASVFSQSNWYWFNPFPFPVATGYPAAMCKDNAGVFWFAADSLMNTVITNQSGSVRYTIPNQPLYYSDKLEINSRNEIWLNHNGNRSFLRNGQRQQLDIPTLAWPATGYVISVADNHHGQQYISVFKNAADSFHIMQFDGTTYTDIDLTNLPATLNKNLWGAGSLICDTAGVLHVSMPNFGVFKYNNPNWQLVDTSHVAPVLTTKNNILYFEKAPGLSSNLDTTYYLLKIEAGIAERISPPPVSLSVAATYYSLSLDEKDRLCFITQTNLMYRLVNNTWQTVYLPDFCCYSGNPWAIPAMLFDSSGNIWMSNDMQGQEIGIYNRKGHYTFSGNVFIDYNQNALRDSADLPLKDIILTQTPDNLVANTDSGGNYSLLFLNGQQNYIINPQPLQYYYVSSGNNIHINPATDSMCCYNIGYTPLLNVYDLEINTTTAFARPGFNSMHWLSYKNNGTVAASDTIVYTFDNRYTFAGANPAPDVVTGNTLKWRFNQLLPFQQRNIAVQLYLPTQISIGDTLLSTATIYPVATDTVPENNVSQCQQLVTGSFDPNEKTVTPAGNINAGNSLTYTIFFQNTGTDTAFNVIILDTLDPSISLASLKILGYSHNMYYNYKGNGILEFCFTNILLPDSHTNEPLSHGYVKYSINTKNNLPGETEIHNTAYIYFDYNAPVQTNTTINTTGVLGINTVETNAGFGLFPNPAGKKTFVKLYQPADRITIYNATGALIYNVQVNNDLTGLPLAGLAPGLYLVATYKNNVCTGTRKLIVQ